MWERLSAMQKQARLPEFLVKNSLSAPTQVFQEYWSGFPPPPAKWKFGQILAVGIGVGLLEYPPPHQTYVGAGVWRPIAVSPKDTVSFQKVSLNRVFRYFEMIFRNAYFTCMLSVKLFWMSGLVSLPVTLDYHWPIVSTGCCWLSCLHIHMTCLLVILRH